jgi:hypothetical protein
MRKIILVLLLVSALIAQAQQKKLPYNYKWAISLSPFALAQIDYTAMAGLEYKINPKIGLAADVGYIFASEYLDFNNNNFKARGIIFRPSARFYLNHRNSFYLQSQAFIKEVTHYKYGWVGKNCVNGIPAFEMMENFRYRRFVYGFNIILGVMVPLNKNQRSFIEFYDGLGIRQKQAKIVNEPNSCLPGLPNIETLWNGNRGLQPSLPGGIKLVFVIN